MPTRNNLVGKRFGRLSVKRYADVSDGIMRYLCVCDCGEERVVRHGNLQNGASQSCGCSRRTEYTALRETYPEEYQIWNGMKERCNNPNSTGYRYYGGRGIKVCQEWDDSFEPFISYIGPRPSPSHTIERKNNDGNYEPGNVRWATYVEQARNRSNNVFFDWNGQQMTMCDLAKISPVSRNTIRYRLQRGWSLEDAVLLPAFSQAA